MKKLTTPISEETIRSLRVGDQVSITGTIFTGRDAVHKYLFNDGKLPCDWTEGVLYHCGPVMLQNDDGTYVCKAAGPTTSTREEPYQAKVIETHKLRAIIGKGGMGAKTAQACKDFGCVYLHAVGGAAQVYAEAIRRVSNVYLLEQFGSPEAIWELQVTDFLAVCTIDAQGHSLHADILESSSKKLEKILS